MAAAHVKSNARHGLRLHPLPVRIMHWINAAAMIIMIMSGWKIYNDEQHGLQWHFFGMWIVVLNGLAYLIYGIVSGRFRSKLFPISLGELVATVRDALTLRLKHDDLTRYNAVQKVLYVGIMLVGIVVVLSGLSIWKPVQLSELATLFYDFQTARLVHFLCMSAIVFFLVVHVALALIVPRSLVAMVSGGPVVKQ
ncbi:MAG: cytochrome b/b6 domain-containing protein [Alphaproteobacteria bacterium]|nr:MAG: cytochrome b/b6 domain-containing protein [Alphaproteobacteria bacterium]